MSSQYNTGGPGFVLDRFVNCRFFFVPPFQRAVETRDTDQAMPELPLPILEGQKSQVLVPGPLVPAGQLGGHDCVPATHVSFRDDLSSEPVYVTTTMHRSDEEEELEKWRICDLLVMLKLASSFHM
jgi:hypothetical protein